MSARRKSTPLISTARSNPSKNSNPAARNWDSMKTASVNEVKGSGTKPTTEAASVKDVMVMMILHLCKKAIFFDVRLKVGLYLLSLFVVSLIGGDFIIFQLK